MTVPWALLSLLRRWQRNLLAGATILLGSAAVVVIAALSTSSSLHTYESFRDDDSDTLRISFGSPADWTIPDRQLRSALPPTGILAAGTFGEVPGSGTLELRTSSSGLARAKPVIANAEGLAAFGARVSLGMPLPEDAVVTRDPNRVLVGTRVARDVGIQPGDEVIVGGRTVHVDGLVTDTGHRSLLATSVVLHPATARAWGLAENAPRVLFVRASKGNAAAVQQFASRALDVLSLGDADVMSNLGPTQLRDKLLAESQGLVWTVTLCVIGVSMLTVFTTLFAATRERRSEIGILYALGTPPRQVTIRLAAESAMLGAVAALAGTCAGVVLSAAACHLQGWRLVLYPWLLAVPPGAVLACLAGAIAPAMMASRINPNELIRSTT